MSVSSRYKLIAAERAYTYEMDDIRLTIISAPTIRQKIREHFGFETSELARPPVTFGPVVQTSPPGIVFRLGEAVTAENRIVVIRSLYIEPTRIVISVLDSSEHADVVFEQLRETVEAAELSNREALLPDPRAILDRSEYSVQTSSGDRAFEQLLNPKYVEIMTHHLLGSGVKDALVISTLDTFVASVESNESIDDESEQRSGAFEAGPRYGADLATGVMRSVAPLDADAHQRFLDDLLRLLDDVL